MHKIKKRLLFLAFFIFFFVVIFLLYLWTHINSEDLVVTNYSVNSRITNSFRIVQLSDLHNSEFGNDNEDLCSLVENQKPDLIFITGDMINRDDPDTKILETLLTKLVTIAPVYYCYGNHEVTWDENWSGSRGCSIADIVDSCGAYALNLEYVDINFKDNQLRIGGYMGYYRFPGMMEGSQSLWEDDNQFFDDFENTDSYKILLNHIPTQWVDWNHLDNFDVDLIFSGHYHGGQWVLPLAGPVYAPYVAWFPEHVKGCFTGEKGSCILSAGLGNEYTYLPRVNNPPEIVVVDLIPEE